MNLRRVWLLVAPTLVLLAMALTQSCGNGLLGQSTICGQSINPFEFVPLISCSPPTPTPGTPGPGISSVSICPASSSSASPTPCPSFSATSIAVGSQVAFEAVASYSDGTNQDVTDSGTTFWSNSNPSILAPAPSPSPSPGEYSGLCPGSSTVSASLNSGLKSQQVAVSVTGTAPSSCPTSSSSPASGAQIIQQQAAAQGLSNLQWSFNARAPIGSTIVAAAAGTVYFTSADGVLHALGSSGQELWSASVGAPALLLDQNQNLYAVGQQGSVKALDTDGSTLWRLDVGADVASLALGPQGTLYAVGSAGLVSFTHEGAVNWSLPGVSGNTLAVSSSGEVIVAAAGGAVFGVSHDGQQNWTMTPAGGFAGALATDSSGNVYAGSASGVLYAVDSSGRASWQFKASDPIVAGPVIGPGATIDFVADGLYALDPSGQLAWHSAAASGANSALVAPITSSQLLVGEAGGVALVLQSGGAASAALKVNGALSALACSSSGQIYLGSQNGYLYAVK